MFRLHGLWTVLHRGLRCGSVRSVCPCSPCAEVHPSLRLPGFTDFVFGSAGLLLVHVYLTATIP